MSTSKCIRPFLPGQHTRSWADTLLYYLDASTEDEAVVGLFDETFLREIRSYLSTPVLKWLDVGPGPGTKTVGIYERLITSCSFETVNLSILEPSSFWIRQVTARNGSFHLDAAYQATFEAFGTEKLCTFDLISLIHVLYDRALTETLLDYLEKLRCTGSRHVVFVVVESPESDFFKIRERMAQKGLIPEWASAAEVLPRELEVRGFRFTTRHAADQACQIDRGVFESDEHWLFPFLIGCSFKQYNALPLNQQKRVQGIAREYVGTTKSGALYTPDVAFTIFL